MYVTVNMDRDLASESTIDESLITNTFRTADTDVQLRPLNGFLANARGLRQGSGELQKHADSLRPDFICVTETHLGGDMVSLLIPRGYKVAARLDRNKHGGGLLICVLKHHLVDVLPLSTYNTVGVAG